jgi:hypothetical protein
VARDVLNADGTKHYEVLQVKLGGHNLCGYRYDVWFLNEASQTVHGVQYGSNSRLRCLRVVKQ